MYHSLASPHAWAWKGIGAKRVLEEGRECVKCQCGLPLNAPKNQESPSGFHKGLTVEYTAVLRVTQREHDSAAY